MRRGLKYFRVLHPHLSVRQRHLPLESSSHLIVAQDVNDGLLSSPIRARAIGAENTPLRQAHL